MGEQEGPIPGLEGQSELTVGEQHLASALGSGLVRVFSTPMLVALMENAAVNAVAPQLAPGQTTVGVRVDIKHLAATPPGMKVRAHARLLRVEGRTLGFEVWAEDGQERIGEGTHERALIDQARFDQRVRDKAARQS